MRMCLPHPETPAIQEYDVNIQKWSHWRETNKQKKKHETRVP